MGHVVGRGIMNAFEGRGDESVAVDAGEEPQAAPQEYSGPCPIQYKSFMSCLANNNNDTAACQWAYDILRECQSVGSESSDYST